MTQETIHFGNPNSNEIIRKTVVGVLYYPETNQFVYLTWPNYFNLTCLVSGGVDENESYIEALKREIGEETGFTDFDILDELGGKIMTHYYQPKKNEYYVKEIKAFLVRLNSLEKTDQNLEGDENFEVKMGTLEEVLQGMKNYQNPNSNNVEDHIEILNRGIILITNTSNKLSADATALSILP